MSGLGLYSRNMVPFRPHGLLRSFGIKLPENRASSTLTGISEQKFPYYLESTRKGKKLEVFRNGASTIENLKRVMEIGI